MNSYTNGNGANLSGLDTMPQTDTFGLPMTGMAIGANPDAEIVVQDLHLSDLDRWTQREFGGLMADQLDEAQLTELSEHISKIAAMDKKLWDARDERMRGDQDALEESASPGDVVATGREHMTKEEREALQDQSYNPPILWSFCNKMTSILCGNGFRIHMTPSKLSDTSKSQQVENYCRHVWTEMSSRMRLSGNADPLRALAWAGRPLRRMATRKPPRFKPRATRKPSPKPTRFINSNGKIKARIARVATARWMLSISGLDYPR